MADIDEARDLGLEILRTAGIEVGGDRPHDIAVHDDRFWARVLADRELGLGESYQEGWWDANQLDEFIAEVQTLDLQSLIRPRPALTLRILKAQARNRQTVRRARRNARAHYDIGNDLYERMLDKRMIYSCGYWRRAADLDEAQEHKLELICRKLHLEPGMRLLDIGCGWGGFARHAAAEHGALVTGVTPAHEQAWLARQVCADLPVDIRECDYRDVEGRFDRIVSIGMMEHVGPRNLKTFFRRCDDLLAEDGMMLHHTIGSLVSKSHTDPWFDKYIFPGGVVPSLAQISSVTEKDWVIEDVHNFGPYYDRTLMAWHRNVSAAWEDLPAYDERFRRTWDYYLLSSAGSFRARALQLWQIVFTRSRRRSDVYHRSATAAGIEPERL
ncbi:MAG: cyclopropane fatty acyl phospholipid synthase [Acidimicrobiaceae bacterium]|nr:cyclopropane fatty acyl phospholipid synthase [Acidimicrobiaceae bacterium]MCY3643070.1 cyclopropane fatty acyl phospholipid synthase [Acidimicrobiaceae bacterium]